MATAAQTDALIAALYRVYPGIEIQKLEIEVSWIDNEIRYEHDGTILWRGFDLGTRLFTCLSEAQNWRCCYCGVRTNEPESSIPTIEHIIPKNLGGLDHPDNMAMACRECNQAHSINQV
jgi:hypothetical protein